jgi:hypothetical protein
MFSSTTDWYSKHKKNLSICIILVLCLASLSVLTHHTRMDEETMNSDTIELFSMELSQEYAPLFFVENKGQINSSEVLFYGISNTICIGLSEHDLYLYKPLTDTHLELEFLNSQPSQLVGLDLLKAKSNFILGSRGEYLNVPCYAQIMYKDIWPEIDLMLSLTNSGLNYEYVIHPRGTSSDIKIRLIRYDACLQPESIERQFIGTTLVGHQNGQEFQAGYVQQDEDTYAFHIEGYNPSSLYTINPLIYSTYVGGSDIDIGKDIAIDEEGNMYITGQTSSTNFPTLNAYDSTYNAGTASVTHDCFIMKIDSLGELVYSTYVGGLFWEEGNGITVDAEGNVYVTGGTTSYDFPTMNGYDESFGGGNSYDCFILILNATGNGLIYSTYIGDHYGDEGHGICIDDERNIYIAGATASRLFPVLNAYDDNWNDGYDCFVLKMNSTGTGLIYSTYVGGTFSLTPPYDDRDDVAVAMAVDEFGNAYVTGYTNSLYFPTVNAIDDSLGSWNTDDCIVFKLNATGNGLVYSTYIGGVGQDQATDISIDSEGCAYITGFTQSTDFPTVGALDSALDGTSDSFLVKLSPEGNQLLYSSFLGGNGTDSGQSLMCDAMKNIYLGGTTTSSDFPVVNGVAYDGNGSADCFVLRLNTTTDSLSYSTCVGGTMDDSVLSLTIDSYGTVYATGSTYSTDFPIKNPYDGTQNGASDVFVFLLPDFGDSDSDGIPDYNESLYGTDRFSADSDLDGLSDYQEIFTYLTNPLSNDTDLDMMTDRWELQHGLNPLDPTDANGDLDSDSLTNLQEYEIGTDPGLSDSDLDGIPDGWEVSMGFNPLDSEIPPVEFLLFNINWVIIGSLIVVSVLAGMFFGVRPRLEKQRMIKKQEEEQEEIENVIKDLREDDTTYT